MIDGATKWQQTRFITLPMLKTIMIIMFIMAVARSSIPISVCSTAPPGIPAPSPAYF